MSFTDLREKWVWKNFKRKKWSHDPPQQIWKVITCHYTLVLQTYYLRARSLHRPDTDTTSTIYPTVPDLDPEEMYPSVPQFDPGEEEEDIFVTLKRSPKKKRAQKTQIDTVD